MVNLRRTMYSCKECGRKIFEAENAINTGGVLCPTCYVLKLTERYLETSLEFMEALHEYDVASDEIRHKKKERVKLLDDKCKALKQSINDAEKVM